MMDISKIAFRLIIILLPGVIATFTVKNLTANKKWNSFDFSIYTILFSGITYVFLQLLRNTMAFFKSIITEIDYIPATLEIWDKITNQESIPFDEVSWACILSVLIGLIATLVIKKEILFKIALKLKISRKSGNSSLYYNFLRNEDTQEIFLRDHENNLIYHGIVDSYFESETTREIVLTNVEVFSSKNNDIPEALYSLESFFFSTKKDSKWHIEIPNSNNN